MTADDLTQTVRTSDGAGGEHSERAADGAPQAAMTLGQLCADLGPELVDVVIAPRGIDVAISGVTLHDPADGAARDDAAGRLLLAVGIAPADAPLDALVLSAGAAGAGAIACRGGVPWPSDVLDLAKRAGVALLSVPAEIAWGELYELMRAAILVEQGDRPEEPAAIDRLELDDLFAIAEATAAIAGGPVTIEDVQSRVLAFSGSQDIDQARMATILNRRVPERWIRELRQLGVHQRLLTSDEVIRVEPSDTRPRRTIAIRLGDDVLGSIWLAGDDGTLSADADEALRRAAPIAALQLMRQRVAGDVERRMRGSALAALLHGDSSGQLALEQLGLRADEPLVVLAIAVTARHPSSPPAIAPRLIDLLTMHLHAYERPTIAASLDERVYVLTNSRGPQDRAALRRIATECTRRTVNPPGLELRVGIGHDVAAHEQLALARRSAEDCLALAPASAPVVAFEDVHGRALLADVAALLGDWRGGPSAAFGLLVEHDAAHGSDYVGTLRRVLDAFGNLAQAAEQLHLHVNTVRYRIKRIAELTGVDLGESDARLALELELRARGPRN
jgi:sugar diacid utilization regulator